MAAYASTQALAEVSAAQTNYLPLAGGRLTGGLSVGLAPVPGPYSIISGNASSQVRSGQYNIAAGQEVSVGGYCNLGVGKGNSINGNNSAVFGRGANATNDQTFVFAGLENGAAYGSHGDGTYNIGARGGADGVWIGTNTLGNMLADRDATIAAQAARIAELEDAASEYWCKWTTNSLSVAETNWIPTNWPARNVYCFVVTDAEGIQIALPDWSPATACTLHLLVVKSAAGSMVLSTANGSALQSMTGTSGAYRDIALSWRPGIGWICRHYAMATTSHVASGASRTSVAASALPEDSAFAPVVGDPPVAQTLSMSPALSPTLSPSLDLQPDAPAIEPEEEAYE